MHQPAKGPPRNIARRMGRVHAGRRRRRRHRLVRWIRLWVCGSAASEEGTVGTPSALQRFGDRGGGDDDWEQTALRVCSVWWPSWTLASMAASIAAFSPSAAAHSASAMPTRRGGTSCATISACTLDATRVASAPSTRRGIQRGPKRRRRQVRLRGLRIPQLGVCHGLRRLRGVARGAYASAGRLSWARQLRGRRHATVGQIHQLGRCGRL